MKAVDYILLLIASIIMVAVLTHPQERPEPPVIVKPVVVEKIQSLVPRSSDRGLTPEARELWYRCVDLWEACEYENEWGPDGTYAETACEDKVGDCHMLVSEANR